MGKGGSTPEVGGQGWMTPWVGGEGAMARGRWTVVHFNVVALHRFEIVLILLFYLILIWLKFCVFFWLFFYRLTYTLEEEWDFQVSFEKRYCCFRSIAESYVSLSPRDWENWAPYTYTYIQMEPHTPTPTIPTAKQREFKPIQKTVGCASPGNLQPS